MKDVIIEAKIREKGRLSESISDTTMLVELAQVSNLIDLPRKYLWAMSNINLDMAKKLRLTGIKKY